MPRLTLPNLLTLWRLVSAPVFLAVFLTPPWPGEEAAAPGAVRLALALALVAASELSDFLDGHLARRRRQVSDFGKLMDPYADSIFRLTCLFSFASTGYRWVPLWTVMVLLYRDLLVSITRTFAMKKGVVIAARFTGKLKAVSQASAIVAILVVALWRALRDGSAWGLSGLGHTLAYILVATSLFSLVDYLRANRRVFAEDAPAADAGTEKPPHA
jgi:CDP-diacylglycerol--glycerol-3-phosphate 3-phosphatidyltransferase